MKQKNWEGKEFLKFNIGDKVFDTTHKCQATVLDNYGDPINGDCGEIRLDSDGNQPIFLYDDNYRRSGYNLIK